MSADRSPLVDLLSELRFRNGGPTLSKIAARLPPARDGSSPSRGYLSEIFSGKRTPSGDLAEALARALGGATHDQQRARTHAEAAARATRRKPEHATDVPAPGTVVRWRRPDYAAHIDNIVPAGGLKDREDDLAKLAEFCTGDAAYLWIQAAPWAGKSALLATFVRNPPPDVDVLAFFITARLATQSDSTAFAEALLDQLSGLLEMRAPDVAVPMAHESQRLMLLRVAAGHADDTGRRLVLVVDGLDEDKGAETGSGLASVASMLPRNPVRNLRIIVSSRRDPPLPDDVPADHPLRNCAVHWLPTSPHASSIAAHARQELQELLLGDPTHVDVIGLLTACADGLTVTELEELTRLDRFRLELLIGGVFGRSVAVRSAHASAPEPVLLFTHDELREQAVGRLGTAIERYRERIHAWAEEYRAKRWPASTPQYLLHGYSRLLQSLPDPVRLIELAADHDRHDRLLAVTGGDAAGLAEVRAAQELIIGQYEPDLYVMVRLALCQDELAARNANIPAGLPALWAALGQPARGEALAWGMTDPLLQNLALDQLAVAVARNGDVRFAQTVAWSIIDARRRERSFAGMVSTAVSIGDQRRAVSLTRRVIDEDRRTQGLLELVDAVLDTGDLPHATALARSISDPVRRAQATIQVLQSVVDAVDAGDGDQVDRLTVEHLTEEAEAAARAVRDPGGRAVALARLARVVEAAGHGARAEQHFAEALSLARSVTDPAGRSRALTQLLPAAGGGQDEDLVAEAVAAAAVAEPAERATLLLELFEAVLAMGDLRRAEELGRSIADPGRRARALTRLLEYTGTEDSASGVDVLAAAARTAADAVAGLGRRALALAELAGALHAAGRADEARRLVAEVTAAAPAITDPGDRAAVWIALIHLVPSVGTGDLERLVGAAHTAVRAVPRSQRTQRTLAQTGLMAAIIAAGGPDRAERYAGALAGAEPRAAALTQLGHAVADGGDHRRAERLAIQAEAAARTVDVVSRAHTLGALAAAVAATGRFGLAERVAAAIPDEQVRSLTFAQLAGAAARTGAFGTAETLVRAVSDTALRSRTSAELAELAATAGDHDRAVAFLDAVHDPDLQAGARLQLAEALLRQGRPEQAQRVAGTFADPLQRVLALILLIKATAVHDVDRAERITTEVDAAIRALPHADERVQAMIQLVGAVVAHDPVRGWRLTAEVRAGIAGLPDQEQQAWLLVQLVEVLAANGEADRAEAVARAIADPQQQAWALVQLIEVLAATGDVERAEAVAHGLPDPDERDRALARLVSAGGAAGGRRAEAIARTLPDPYRQAEALTDLATSLAGRGELDRAEAIAKAVNDPERQSWALAQVSSAAVDAGDLDRAERMIHDMPVPEQRVPVLTALIAAVRAAGDQHRAEQLAAEAEAAVRTITQPDRQVQAINALVTVVPLPHARRLLAVSLGLSSWKQCLLRLADVAAPVVLRTAEDLLGTPQD